MKFTPIVLSLALVFAPTPTFAFDVNEQLLNAAAVSNVLSAREALEAGANPNYRNRSGETPLHILARSSFKLEEGKQIAELLVAMSADVNAQDNSGFTPVIAAAANLNKEWVAFFIVKCANVNIKTRAGYSAIQLVEANPIATNNPVIIAMLKSAQKRRC